MSDDRHDVVLRMVSRVDKREDFLDAFHPFVDEHSVLVITKSVPAQGALQRFSIELKGGIPVLRGEGMVADTPLGPFEPGMPVKMRLRIVRWEEGSEETHQQLLERKRRVAGRRAARASVPPPPPPSPPSPPGPSTSSRDDAVTDQLPTISAAAPPREEQRTPGSSYQLPANPFSEIPDHILEDFIDCVLHPDVAQGPPGSSVEPAPERPADADAPPSFRSWTPPVAAPEAAATQPAVPAAPPVVASPPVVVRTSLAPHLFTALLAAAAAAAGTYIYLTRVHSPATAEVVVAPQAGVPAADGAPAPAALPAAARPAGPAARPAEPPSPPAGTAVAAARVPAEPAASAGSDAPAPAAPAAAAPTPAGPAPAEAPPTAPVDPPAAAVDPANADRCLASVRSHPEAKVYVGEAMVGRPPLDAELPCDESTLVAIVHPRYQRWERKVVGRRGEPVVMDVQLSRELLELSVNTAPGGATIAVDGRIIGKSPARTEVKGYTSVLVTASLDGYKLWSRRVKLTSSDAVSARLDPIPGVH